MAENLKEMARLAWEHRRSAEPNKRDEYQALRESIIKDPPKHLPIIEKSEEDEEQMMTTQF